MFYLLEKEVIESNYEVAKKLFVEIYNSKEAYIEFVMIEFNETDKLEKFPLAPI
jgi:aromatic ring-opening dioxygenase LigB subunit